MHAVARHLDDAAAMLLDDRSRERVVARERVTHARGLGLPKPRAAFDIGEQERRDGRLRHGAHTSRLNHASESPAEARSSTPTAALTSAEISVSFFSSTNLALSRS